jgi:ribosomal protein L37E
VAAPPQTLEALVRDELRGPVSELVRQVVVEHVREQLNGATPAPVETMAANGTASTTRICKTCGRELPLNRFAPHRHECKSCRNARYPRNRRARGAAKASTGDEEPPRTGPAEGGSGA